MKAVRGRQDRGRKRTSSLPVCEEKVEMAYGGPDLTRRVSPSLCIMDDEVLVVGGWEARRSGGQRAAAEQDCIGHKRRDA